MLSAKTILKSRRIEDISILNQINVNHLISSFLDIFDNVYTILIEHKTSFQKQWSTKHVFSVKRFNFLSLDGSIL